MSENRNQPTATTQIRGSDSPGMTDANPRSAYAQKEMPVPSVVYAPIPGVTSGTPIVPAQIAPATPPTEQK